MEKQDNTRLFNLDERTEQITVKDLNLFNKDTQLPKQNQKIFVGQFEKESRPLTVILRPYVQVLVKGAGTAAHTAAGLGYQALGAVSSAIVWGYHGLKSLLTKTAEYIEPKFVLLTSKKQPTNEQLELIDKLQQDKEMAVVGIQEFNELKQMGNNKGPIRVIIPADEEFMNYLKNEKYTIKNQEWVEEVDPTKSIVMPSQSFTIMLDNFQPQRHPIANKEIYNYGKFCAFDLEGKNEIEYELQQQLRLSPEHIEGFMVRAKDVVRQDSSNGSRSDYEGLLVEDNYNLHEASDLLTDEERRILQQKPIVTVKEVPLLEHEQITTKIKQLQFA